METALSLSPTSGRVLAEGIPGRADLHMHTTYSDGRDRPELVLEWAETAGLDVIAITDHDTIEGALVCEALARANRSPLEVILGIEVSSGDGHIALARAQ